MQTKRERAEQVEQVEDLLDQYDDIEQDMLDDCAALDEAIRTMQDIRQTIADPYEAKLAELRAQVVALVPQIGETVHGQALMAVYYKPSWSFNKAKLQGLFDARPDLDIEDYARLKAARTSIRHKSKE